MTESSAEKPITFLAFVPIAKGKEQRAEELWRRGIEDINANWTGKVNFNLFKQETPGAEHDGGYVVLIHFDSEKTRDAWFGSELHVRVTALIAEEGIFEREPVFGMDTRWLRGVLGSQHSVS